jgi:hypothetical protein
MKIWGSGAKKLQGARSATSDAGNAALAIDKGEAGPTDQCRKSFIREADGTVLDFNPPLAVITLPKRRATRPEQTRQLRSMRRVIQARGKVWNEGERPVSQRSVLCGRYVEVSEKVIGSRQETARRVEWGTREQRVVPLDPAKATDPHGNLLVQRVSVVLRRVGPFRRSRHRRTQNRAEAAVNA